MLTTKECEAVVPGTKPIKLFDGLGLYLHVTTGGHKGWRWKYRFGGKERGLVFGSFPEISLKRARDMRDDARALLRQGVDPGDERRRAALRRIAGVDANSTFQVVAERWHTMQAPQWKERHASDVITSLTNEVFPYLGGRPLGEIKPVDVRAVLDRVQMRGAVETAHRLRQRISAVFRYAIASDIAETDPAAFVGAALQPVRKRKQPAFRELDAARAFLMAYEAVPGHPTTKLASPARADSGASGHDPVGRAARVRGSGRPQPDLAGSGRENEAAQGACRERGLRVHPAALRQAVATVKAARLFGVNRRYLFPSARHAHRPITENALNVAYRRVAGFEGKHVPHGWRSTFSTIMNERAIEQNRPADRAIIDLMLAHVPKDKVESAYNRASYMPRRRELAQEWADLISEGLAPVESLLAVPRR
jgi:integrase